MKIAIVNLITRMPLVKTKAPEVRSNKDAMIVKFSKELQKHGIDIDLYVSDSYQPQVREELGVNIKYLRTVLKPIFWPSLIPFTPSLPGELMNRYDIVVCSEAFQWSTVLAVLSRIISRRKKAKIVVWQEMSGHQRMLKKMPSKFFHGVVLKYFLDKNIAAYIPRSGPAKAFLLEQGIESRKIASAIPHGIDQDVFFYDPSIGKEDYIFSPSRLVFSKGVDVLLKSFSMVQEKLGRVRLIIQGEGPGLGEYMRLAKELGIGEKVIFCTDKLSHDRMRARYRKALVTVISSRSDLFMFSAMESIACGTPVIISSGVDSHLIFSDDKGGMVFRNEDRSQLAGLMAEIVGNDALRANMEREAVEKSKAYFNDRLSGLFATALETIKESRHEKS